MQELLKIRGLTVRFYTYEGVVEALTDVDLEMGRKETLGLVGETGCGKTMTALAILRLVAEPGRIESGAIYFSPDGDKEPVDLLKLKEAQMRAIRGSKISMVFQEPGAALNPVYTIGNQISEAILVHRRGEVAAKALSSVTRKLKEGEGLLGTLFKPFRRLQRRLYSDISRSERAFIPRIIGRIPLIRGLLWRLNSEAAKIAVEMLKEVEIPDAERVAKQYPHQLSGGMKQRAVIAMAIVCYPKLLIADEPTTSLDVTVQSQILELLDRLKDEFQSSVLYITHDLSVAAEICDRIGIMYAGRMCEVGSAEEIFKKPLHPYTRALLAAVPEPGKEPRPISGSVPDPLEPPPGCRFHPRCTKALDLCKYEVPGMLEVTKGHLVSCHVIEGGRVAGSD